MKVEIEMLCIPSLDLHRTLEIKLVVCYFYAEMLSSGFSRYHLTTWMETSQAASGQLSERDPTELLSRMHFLAERLICLLPLILLIVMWKELLAVTYLPTLKFPFAAETCIVFFPHCFGFAGLTLSFLFILTAQISPVFRQRANPGQISKN